jgi:hypothetical protein
MDEFYVKFFESQCIAEGEWRRIDIPFQSAQKLAGQFTMVSGGAYFSTAWWLGGAHDVKVHGNARVCKTGYRWYVKDLQAQWQWHDQIDAHDYATLVKQNADGVVVAFEGTWDILIDKVMAADFEVIIHFRDSIAETTFPPGPMP